MRIAFFVLLIISCLKSQTLAQTKGPVRPSPAQLQWHETNFYLFFHFGPNTFTNREWGHGTETEDVFNPSALDCDQWCRIAKQAGAKGVIITAKHHDGFCLWPSKYSTHTVRESKWKNGKGDVLRELSDACRRHGLKFGVYLSPWDRNHPKYGTSEYNDVYANTLTELLTSYGDLFEVWWDGANGEGPNGKKQVYDFHRFEKLVAKHQPNAIIFSDIGPGCRWAGNEQGTVSETNWCMLDTVGFGRGATGPPSETLQTGQETAANWIPAECDVSIRPGWFYHAEEDNQVKSPDQLFEIYLKSSGRGANLILNVPPDPGGRIHASDSAALVAFGEKLHNAFATDLAKNKKIKRNLLDLGHEASFNTILLREDISKGQRVKSFKIQSFQNGKWEDIVQSTTIGAKKILQFKEIRTRKLKVIWVASNGAPALKAFEIYKI
jgi:alpha-L-fucosidase